MCTGGHTDARTLICARAPANVTPYTLVITVCFTTFLRTEWTIRNKQQQVTQTHVPTHIHTTNRSMLPFTKLAHFRLLSQFFKSFWLEEEGGGETKSAAMRFWTCKHGDKGEQV